MNNRMPGFSVERVAQFRSMFSSTRESAQEILKDAPWAIDLLNKIHVHMDEDTSIEETLFVNKSKIRVTVLDLNTREKLRLSLVWIAAKEITCCLDEYSVGRKIHSSDLIRIAMLSTPKA